MKTNPDVLLGFAHKQTHTTPLLETDYVVTLSRVSSKKQFRENISIENQERYFDDYAKQTGKVILARFGGTYESASVHERKELKKMLDFIKKNNTTSPKKISQIWVYMTDRFDRTGLGGMVRAAELREKYGVALFALAQPTSVKDDSGVFSQNIQFLVSEYENRQRRRRMIDGMTAKFQKGDWVTVLPMGYSAVKENKIRRIVINEEGKFVKQAFHWKADGMKNEEILSRLNAMGCKMYKQKLTKIFKKPFYCGYINHGFLDGQIVPGNHEALISLEVFLKVNDIHTKMGNYGVPHKKERKELPLKVFLKCEECNEPMTGYTGRKKTKKKVLEFYYYKCRTKGCQCNKNADTLHDLFQKKLEKYQVKEEFFTSVQYDLISYFQEVTKERIDQEALLKGQLVEVNKKIETIEERYFALNEMTKEVFDRFHSRYVDEKAKIAKLLHECAIGISNLNELILQSIEFGSKLNTVWTLGSIKVKEGIQKLVFPKGIAYSKKNGLFRTLDENFVFRRIAAQAGVSAENKNGDRPFFDDLSPAAERKGFEPLIGFLLYTLSRRASSTTPAPLREGCKNKVSLLTPRIFFQHFLK